MAGEGRTPTPSDDLDVFGKELPLTCECVCVSENGRCDVKVCRMCACESVCVQL